MSYREELQQEVDNIVTDLETALDAEEWDFVALLLENLEALSEKDFLERGTKILEAMETTLSH